MKGEGVGGPDIQHVGDGCGMGLGAECMERTIPEWWICLLT